MFANVLLHLLCNKFCFSEVLLSKKFKIILKSQYQIWVIYFRRHISVFSSMCFKFLQNIFSEKISAWLLLIIAPHNRNLYRMFNKTKLINKKYWSPGVNFQLNELKFTDKMNLYTLLHLFKSWNLPSIKLSQISGK